MFTPYFRTKRILKILKAAKEYKLLRPEIFLCRLKRTPWISLFDSGITSTSSPYSTAELENSSGKWGVAAGGGGGEGGVKVFNFTVGYGLIHRRVDAVRFRSADATVFFRHAFEKSEDSSLCGVQRLPLIWDASISGHRLFDGFSDGCTGELAGLADYVNSFRFKITGGKDAFRVDTAIWRFL